jgi:alpha-ribazole phosphatase
MRVVLVRHLKPEIEAGICYGRLDVPVHPECAGRARDIAMAPVMTGLKSVWSSPARRCRELAEAIAGAQAAQLQFDPRLLEMDFGAWEGMRWDDIARTELDRWAADPVLFKAPGGETGQALIDRVASFARCLSRLDEDCLVVSHGGPLKILPALLRRQTIDLLSPPPVFGSVVEICLMAPDVRPDDTIGDASTD